MPPNSPDPTLAGIKEVLEITLASGIPQQLIQIGGNLATSFVQAGAQNPLYASMVAVGAANLGKGIVWSGSEANAMKLVAGTFVVKELATGLGGFTSKSQSKAMTYDIPDVQVPRLGRFPPPGEAPVAIPRLPAPRRIPIPDPVPVPLTDPARVIDVEPISEPISTPIRQPEPFTDPTGQPFAAPSPSPLLTDREVALVTAAGAGAAAAGAATGSAGAGGRAAGARGISQPRRSPTIAPPV